ncbi:DIX domain-containing protein [Ditylenchus destructor]|nr:DIX domain-containing protein [Ditylenchus destructor]
MTSFTDDNVAVDDATESTSKLTLQDDNSAQPSSKQSTPLRQPAPPVHQRNTSADSSQNDGKSKNSGTLSNGFGGDVEVAKSEVSSQASSQQSRSKSSQTTSGGADGTRRTTKVYYHIDDETTPYCTEVPVPADRITLGDFKRVLNRSNFKFYCKAIDQEVGGEVKAEIRDDSQLLHKSSNGARTSAIFILSISKLIS